MACSSPSTPPPPRSDMRLNRIRVLVRPPRWRDRLRAFAHPKLNASPRGQVTSPPPLRGRSFIFSPWRPGLEVAWLMRNPFLLICVPLFGVPGRLPGISDLPRRTALARSCRNRPGSRCDWQHGG